MILVEQTLLPLRLAAAAFVRTLDLTSGQVLYPFADAPHIVNDGIILHRRSARQRALVHRIIHYSPIWVSSLPQMRDRSGASQAS